MLSWPYAASSAPWSFATLATALSSAWQTLASTDGPQARHAPPPWPRAQAAAARRARRRMCWAVDGRPRPPAPPRGDAAAARCRVLCRRSAPVGPLLGDWRPARASPSPRSLASSELRVPRSVPPRPAPSLSRRQRWPGRSTPHTPYTRGSSQPLRTSEVQRRGKHPATLSLEGAAQTMHFLCISYDGARQTWNPQHVNKKAVRNSRDALESPLFQCGFASCMCSQTRHVIRVEVERGP